MKSKINLLLFALLLLGNFSSGAQDCPIPPPKITPQYEPRCGLSEIPAGPSLQFCTGDQITLFVSGQQGSTFDWTIPASVPSYTATNDQVTLELGAPGLIEVCVTETSSAACINEACTSITIHDLPTASLEAVGYTDNPIDICLNQQLTFLSTTPNPASNGQPLIDHTWTVTYEGNPPMTVLQGRTATQLDYTFNTPGFYLVSLQVTSCYGCESPPVSIGIEVSEGTVRPIECPSVVCEGQTVSYSTPACPSDLNALFTWNFYADGMLVDQQTGNPVATTWTLSNLSSDFNGFGIVELISNCPDDLCDEVSTFIVPIIPAQPLINGPEELCSPDTTACYSIPNWAGASYNWTATVVSGSGSPTPTTGQGNTFCLSMNGFSGELNINVDVDHAIAGCTSSSAVAVSVDNYLIFGPLRGCFGNDAEFTLNTAPAGAGYQVTWQLYNNANQLVTELITNNSINVTFPGSSFTNSGLYRVEAQILEGNGATIDCISPFVFDVLEEVPAVADPTEVQGPRQVCLGQSYIYSYQNTVANTEIVWDADLGQVMPSTGTTVEVVWDNPNALGLTRTRDFNGLVCSSDRVEVPVEEAQFPNISISGPQEVCADNPHEYSASFDGASDYQWAIDPALGTIISGQGSATVMILWHFPVPAPATATIRLLVDFCGTTMSFSYPVTVTEPPAVLLEVPQEVCTNTLVSFSANTNPTSTEWFIQDLSFGNNNPIPIGTGDAIDYTFTNPGPYLVSVRVTGIGSCRLVVEESQAINVQPQPELYLTTPDGIPPLCDENNPLPFSLTLYPQLFGAVGNYSYEWRYNGTVVGTDPTFTVVHIPGTNPALGLYTLEIDNGFCKASASFDVNYPGCPETCKDALIQPEITLINYSGCGAAAVIGRFLDDAGNVITLPSPEVVSPRWTISDPTGANPPVELITTNGDSFFQFYNFPATGFYPITLQALDQNGCLVIVNDILEISVISDFSWTYECSANANEGYRVRLRDESQTLPGTTPNGWGGSWTVTDNGLNIVNDPTEDFVFTAPKSNQSLPYYVCLNRSVDPLTRSTPSNCEACYTIWVPVTPEVDFEFSTNCQDNPVQFETMINQDYTGIKNYFWDFGDGTFSSIANPAKEFYSSGTQIVTLTVTTDLGCTFSTTKNIDLIAGDIDGSLLAQPDDCPTTAQLQFDYTGSGNPADLSYNWNTGESDPSITVTQSGIYALTVSDANGCTFVPDPLPVLLTNPFPTGISGARNVCSDDAISLCITPQSGFEYAWGISPPRFFNSNTPGCISTNPVSQPYTQPAYTFTVNAMINGQICASESVVVNILPSPDAPEVIVEYLSCDPFSARLSLATPPTAGQEVLWTNLFNIIGSGPTLEVFSGGTYQVNIVNENGCGMNSDAIGVFPPIDFSAFLTGCYEFCREDLISDPQFLAGIPGTYDSWAWLLDGMPHPSLPSGTGEITPLPLIPEIAGKITLLITNNGCTEESGPFCFEVIECTACTPPGDPIVEVINCDQNGVNEQVYYVKWNIPKNGSDAEPCNFDDISFPGGYFIPGSIYSEDANWTWTFEGLMVVSDSAPGDKCWEVPFCIPGTDIECARIQVCPSVSGYNDLLEPCPVQEPCNLDVSINAIECVEDPCEQTSHLIDLRFVLPLPPNATFDILISTRTGRFNNTVGLPYYVINNVSANANGFYEGAIQLDWHDEILLDYACFEFFINYTSAPFGPYCQSFVCFDLNDYPCTTNATASNYVFTHNCHWVNAVNKRYYFDLRLPDEPVINVFSGSSTVGELRLLRVLGNNTLRGFLTVPLGTTSFDATVTVGQSEGDTREYCISELLDSCEEAEQRQQNGDTLSSFGAASEQLKVWPNPASNQVWVAYEMDEKTATTPTELRLVNILGVELQSEILPSGTQPHSLNTSALTPGVYYLLIQRKGKIVATQKLIINPL